MRYVLADVVHGFSFGIDLSCPDQLVEQPNPRITHSQTKRPATLPLSVSEISWHGGFLTVLRNFLFRVCFCKIFVCLVFLSFLR
jgi:hypothetical protein